MTTIRLRPWQRAALEAFFASDSSDFLAVATPGAGKTTFALTAARQTLAQTPLARLVVVAPTAHLKVQWADAAQRFGLHLEPFWSASAGLPDDLHGAVVTYQQVASDPEAIRSIAAGSFAIFDEVHHAASDRAWGDSLKTAFTPAIRRLSLSGTPFRSDTQAIPFVNYHLDEAVADMDYGYDKALADRRVVRPVYFPKLNGHMEWVAPDGSQESASFDDALNRTRSSYRLRTALSMEGEWLPAVLRKAHDQLMEIRQSQPEAGGLVIATDQDHAREIAQLLRERFNVRATVATSDDPTASDRIAKFSTSTTPWIVAVRMVSEGVDIPRLRVGVFATTTTTELFFRQAVGRLVRWMPGIKGGQKAYLFIPDDPRLRTWAHQIAEQRKHSLRKKESDDEYDGPSAELDAAQVPDDGEEQLSLFAALSATPDEEFDAISLFDDGDEGEEPAEDVIDLTNDDSALDITLAPLPMRPGAAPGSAAGRNDPRAYRKTLRDRNANRALELVDLLGWTHAQVNFELNHRSGVKKISEATIDQLEARAAYAERWIEKARFRLRSAGRR